MEIVNSLFSDKKTVIIMAITYVIVMVVAFVIIWKPDFELEVSKYKPYDENVISKEMATYYFNSIQDAAVYQSKPYLNTLISDDYLYYTGNTLDNILVRIKCEKKYPTVTNINIYNLNDIVIYTGFLNSDNEKVPVCIVEKYPYDIKVSFDNFVEYYEINNSTIKNGVAFRVKSVYRNIDYIEYVIEVENVDATNCKIDCSVASNFYLKTSNNQTIYMNNPYDSVEFNNIDKNNISTRKLLFKLSIENQEDIKSLNLKNVIVDGKKVEVEIIL